MEEEEEEGGGRRSPSKESAGKLSKRSDDTLWSEAEDPDEDDLEETTGGESKQKTLFDKLERFITRRFGKKGSETRAVVAVEEVVQHTSDTDFWVVVDGKVFDLGPFLRGEARHPGGKSILTRQLQLGGQEAGERFVRWHHPSGNTVRKAPDYFVGDLAGALPGAARGGGGGGSGKRCCAVC
mmetsp:Transcript_99445/g.281549  ORF Transcript_99445/g.281549 Transcript_99445/m.281549 type:complete len:182 (+) Transcript_99445:38-583(+)